MSVIRALARPMLASVFVTGGLDTLRRPAPKVPAADPVVSGLAECGCPAVSVPGRWCWLTVR
jgi:hypothetical protein